MDEEVELLVELDVDSLVDINVDEDSLTEVEVSLLDESAEVVDESTLVVVESDDELLFVVAF